MPKCESFSALWKLPSIPSSVTYWTFVHQQTETQQSCVCTALKKINPQPSAYEKNKHLHPWKDAAYAFSGEIKTDAQVKSPQETRQPLNTHSIWDSQSTKSQGARGFNCVMIQSSTLSKEAPHFQHSVKIVRFCRIPNYSAFFFSVQFPAWNILN